MTNRQSNRGGPAEALKNACKTGLKTLTCLEKARFLRALKLEATTLSSMRLFGEGPFFEGVKTRFQNLL